MITIDTIGERIRFVRKYYRETQEKFSAKIGIRQNSLTQIETGSRNPSNLVINAIMHEYRVRREWLAYGDGEMFEPNRDNDLEIVTSAMEGCSENKKKLIRLIAQMPDDLLDRMMEYLEGRQKK